MPDGNSDLVSWTLLAAPALLALFCCRRWTGRWRFIAYAFGIGYIALGSALAIWIYGDGEQTPERFILLAPSALVVWVVIWGMHRWAVRTR